MCVRVDFRDKFRGYHVRTVLNYALMRGDLPRVEGGC